MKELSREDIIDILKGCVILGTGGGGAFSEGLEMVEEIKRQGKRVVLADVSEIPDHKIIVTPYMLGAVSEIPEEEQKKYEGLPRTEKNPFLIAMDKLEQFYGDKVYGTIACETGGSNTAAPMFVAAMNDGVILDADIAGRAVPEVQNSTYYIAGLPASPIFVSNEFGEVVVFENIKDDARAENVLRSFATESKNNIACIDHALPMKELRHAIIPGTLSKAMVLGKTQRLALADPKSVAPALAEVGGGIVAFSGTVQTYQWKTESGFTFGTFEVRGTGKNESDILKVWFKNENLMSWLNDELFVTLPDLICVINTDTGEPVENPNFRDGMNIAVLVYPAPEAFTTEKGLEAFGPGRFGFDIDYTPAIGRIKAIN